MSENARRKLFTLWFGLGHPPLVAGAIVISFMANLYAGFGAVIVAVAHTYVSAVTTCRRCPFYGTRKCGLMGLAVPMFFARLPTASLPRRRIQAHFFLDLSALVLLNAVYCLQPWLLPLPLVWSAGVWMISFGPKRYHGLLYRLREPENAEDRRISLKLVQHGQERTDGGS